MDVKNQIDTFCRFTQVSRETIASLIKYEKLLINANKAFNLIGKSTINSIWTRHFLDSAQLIDLIDKNDESILDLGSGAGFPGLILAILAKDRKIRFKTILVEKSSKKTKFLRKIISTLDLNVEIINKNILKDQVGLAGDVFIARAFKPLDVILKLIHNNAKNWNKIFIYLGKSGTSQLLQASKIWDMKYKQRVSITSSDSVIIEINKLEKK